MSNKSVGVIVKFRDGTEEKFLGVTVILWRSHSVSLGDDENNYIVHFAGEMVLSVRDIYEDRIIEEPSDDEFDGWNLEHKLNYLSYKVASECKKTSSRLKGVIDKTDELRKGDNNECW